MLECPEFCLWTSLHPSMVMLSHVRLFVTVRTVAHQALLCMEFPRQEYWSGRHFLLQGNLLSLETEPTSPVSPALQVDSLSAEPSGTSLTLLICWMVSSISQGLKIILSSPKHLPACLVLHSDEEHTSHNINIHLTTSTYISHGASDGLPPVSQWKLHSST